MATTEEPISIRMAESIDEVDAAAWDALDHGGSPFLEHAFLAALEGSGSIGASPGGDGAGRSRRGRGRTGWDPVYVLAEQRSPCGRASLVGGVAAFVKSHSYGEYIFDFMWARASQRAGIPYYPKLVVAAPMTPATGPRLLVAPEADRDQVVDSLVGGVREAADEHGCSSIHWLYVTERDVGELASRGYSERSSLQFHWRNPGYESFEDFLSGLVSRRRKQIRKERQRAREAVDAIDFASGGDLGPRDLAAIDRFYRDTVAAHGGMDYLRPGFFEAVSARAPERTLFARGLRGGEPVAGALFFQTERALYGRYWGADIHTDCLHFELAYYAAIERCIERGTPLFEAGAQGEHKLLRGFSPAITKSAHWIRHPELARAVASFLVEEARAVEAHARELGDYLPYKRKE